jgi:hypothetical protein
MSNQRIKELKAELKTIRKNCMKYGQWECGYCAELKWRLEKEIERLENLRPAARPGKTA